MRDQDGVTINLATAHHPRLPSPQHHLDIVNAAGLRTIVPMADAIELVEDAMRALSDGAVDAPPRWVNEMSDNGLMALMPGSLPLVGRFGIKVLSLFEPDARADLPGHQGMMLLFHRETGQPIVVIEANALTALRTAAASAVATRLLSRPGSEVLALIGCGEQAAWHARALPLVRPIREVRVWGRSEARARAFAERHLGHIPKVSIAPSVRSAVKGADIICTLTHAATPLVTGNWLEPGQHLNLVGASTASFREVDDEVVLRSRLVVEIKGNALDQGGELIHAIEAGLIDAGHIHAEIGEILGGTRPGRDHDDLITAYKSLGHVAQDLAVATAVERRLQGVAWPHRIAW